MFINLNLHKGNNFCSIQAYEYIKEENRDISDFHFKAVLVRNDQKNDEQRKRLEKSFFLLPSFMDKKTKENVLL